VCSPIFDRSRAEAFSTTPEITGACLQASELIDGLPPFITVVNPVYYRSEPVYYRSGRRKEVVMPTKDDMDWLYGGLFTEAEIEAWLNYQRALEAKKLHQQNQALLFEFALADALKKLSKEASP
jgi:hypothetical protein